jgi:hypothetical protein
MKLRSRKDREVDAEIAALIARVHPPKQPVVSPIGDIDARIAAALRARDTAEKAKRERRALAAVTSTSPCVWCGDVRFRIDRGAYGEGVHGPECDSCEWHLGSYRWFGADGRRDYAAGWLIGCDEQEAPVGIGARLGLVFWYELPVEDRPTAARQAFSWHSDDELTRWHVEVVPQPVIGSLEPSPPRTVGRGSTAVRTKPTAVLEVPSPREVVQARRARW